MRFDHVAISGETLQSAQAYVEDALGVPLQPGGEHDVFHTHNMLLGLEDGLYLEAISINPNAPGPARPRWFDLDHFSGTPRLTNWICATDDLPGDLTDLGAAFGTPVSLKRGDLRWRMAVPQSGRLPFENCAPALIQWDSDDHPARRLTQRGVRLLRLTVSHPDVTALQDTLTRNLVDDRIAFEQGTAGLSAEFHTPHGRRSLAP